MNEDFDVDDELGFAPAISASGAEPDAVEAASTAPVVKLAGKPRRRSWRRRLAGGLVLIAALASMGGAYAIFAGSSGATGTSATDTAAGRQLYETSCITCHGANLSGVSGRGVSLLGVGGAAVDFQVSTGRMPASGQGSENLRKTAKFTQQQIDDLAAYVQSKAGGPTVPSGNLKDGDIAAGGELFRLNCASCHGTTGKGAPLSAGAVAPSLNHSTSTQLYEAMLTGPENMPVFSNNQLTPQEKQDIIAYVQNMKAAKDPGGNGIDRIGPVSEGLVIWVAGIGVLLIAILWIGAKS